jgi:hypothetical protein
MLLALISKMTRQRIRRGIFRSIADLQTAINAYLAEHYASPKPFVWTKSADAILAKPMRRIVAGRVARLHQKLEIDPLRRAVVAPPIKVTLHS